MSLFGNILGGNPGNAAINNSPVIGNPSLMAHGSILQNSNTMTTLPQVSPMYTLGSGNLVIKQVRNGFEVMVVGQPGFTSDTYVATDVDNLCDVIKLALVNKAMDAAK